MAADNLLIHSTTEAWAKAHESQEQKWPLARIGTGVRTATLALALGVGSAQAQQPTEPVQWPILIAQANIEDGRTWPYYVEIIMVGGWKKKIEFYRNKRWAAIPPPVENGKLMNGEKAPTDAVEARIAQKELMAKYDKWAQTALVMVGSKDLIWDSLKQIKSLRISIEKWENISRNDLSEGFFSAYILMLSWQNVNEIIKAYELIGTKLLKITPSEVAKVKQDAEQKAKEIWKSATWAILS